MLFVVFGVNNKFLNMALYFVEHKIYNMAENLEKDEDNFYEDDDLALELSNSVHLSKNINGTSQNTNRWLCRNIKNKKKPKNLIKFKPKYYSPILNNDFIRMSMILALDAYTGKFRIGKIILTSEENDLYKPIFYCVEDFDNLFVVTRGSDALIDWVTDFICVEVHQEINGKNIYFHKGFYNAANYILGKIMDILKQIKKPIYFIGHSYAGAVSTILALLTKSDHIFQDKDIYAIVFAPPPAISYCPPKIADCIFTFINRYDFVTSFSLFNLVNTAAKNHCATKIIVNRCLKTLKSVKMEWVKYLIYAIEQNFEQITAKHEFLNVRKVKGKIYRIGNERKKRLSDYRINDSQLPNTLSMELTAFVDHLMPEYIKSFKVVQF